MSPEPAESVGLLVGNSFPLSLVRRRVVIEPTSVEDFRGALAGKKICSFWGHGSTLSAVNRFLGVDFTPVTERPALRCDPATGLPVLDGQVFSECWVVSPEYEAGVRPSIGAEVPPAKIKSWQVLRLTWVESTVNLPPLT